MDAAQLRRAILPLSILLLIFLYTYACVPRRISDLHLISIQRLPPTALPAADDVRAAQIQRRERVWKITFDGDAAWIREVWHHELNSYAIAIRCDRRDWEVFADGPYVGGQRIGQLYTAPQVPSGTSTVRYDIYIPETGRYRSEADFNVPMPNYNLGKQSLELCFSIAGGSMIGAYARSNEVHVRLGART